MLMTQSVKQMPDNATFEDWVAQVELVANHFTKKHGVKPTHISVHSAEQAEKLAEIYDGQYLFTIGQCLPNELRLGVPQKEKDKRVDELTRHQHKQDLEAAQDEDNSGSLMQYDNDTATVILGNVKILDVLPEDVVILAKDHSYIEQMKLEYDWESVGKVSA